MSKYSILLSAKDFFIKHLVEVISSIIAATLVFIISSLFSHPPEHAIIINELTASIVAAFVTFGILNAMSVVLKKHNRFNFLDRIRIAIEENKQYLFLYDAYLSKKFNNLKLAIECSKENKDISQDPIKLEKKIYDLLNEDTINIINNSINGHSKFRELYKTYLEHRIEHASDVFNEIMICKGAELKEQHASIFYDFLFKNGQAPYNGLELKLPSRCMMGYGDYIQKHEIFEERHKNPGIRIIVIDKVKLQLDCEMNKDAVEKFLQFHYKYNVELLQLDVEIYKELTENNGMPKAEIGIWENSFVLLFTNMDLSSEKKIRLVKIITSESEYNQYKKYYNILVDHTKNSEIAKEKEKYTNVIEYCKDIIKKDRQEERNEIIKFASIMTGYIDQEKRMAGVNGNKGMSSFLEKDILISNSLNDKILDAAGNMGYEVEWLLEQGYNNIVYNERYEEFYKITAKRLANRHLKMVNIHWGLLDEYFNRSEFKLILLLGNQFSKETKPERRELSIESLYNILEPGGRLIIDCRNYKKVKEAYKINMDKKDSCENFFLGDYGYKRRVIYCGEDVDAFPIKMDPDENNQIIFTFKYHSKNSDKVAKLKLASFGEKEMKILFESKGFKLIETYYDLISEKHESSDKTKCDFITFVFKK